jgi:hypothetical protein
MSENVGASTSRNPKGLHGLYRDNFTLLFTSYIFFLIYHSRATTLYKITTHISAKLWVLNRSNYFFDKTVGGARYALYSFAYLHKKDVKWFL